MPPLLRPAPLPRPEPHTLLSPRAQCPVLEELVFLGCQPLAPPSAIPEAYLAVTAQVISIVQPLALGEGELVPPLYKVTQSCVHLAIIDSA